MPSLGKAHKIAVLNTVEWCHLFKQSWDKSIISAARSSQAFLMIKGGALFTAWDLLPACNIAFFTSLLEHVCHSIIQSRDSMSKSASLVVQPVQKICEVGVKKACFNAFLFSLLDGASSLSVFWIGGVIYFRVEVGYFITWNLGSLFGSLITCW